MEHDSFEDRFTVEERKSSSADRAGALLAYAVAVALALIMVGLGAGVAWRVFWWLAP